jgi:hypothetical protein
MGPDENSKNATQINENIIGNVVFLAYMKIARPNSEIV